MKRLIALAASAVLVLAFFASCGKQGNSNGKLVIYSPNTESIVNAIIPRFEAASGVKVDIISAGTGEIWKRIASEKNNPNADLVWSGQYPHYKPELLETYVSIHNDEIMPQYRNIDGTMTPFCLDGAILAVNSNLIGDIRVESYADLLNPALKGKMIIGDPTNSGSAFQQLINILTVIGGNDYTSPDNKGWEYLRQLLVQIDGKIGQSSSTVHKGVADGEYTVALTYEDPVISYIRDGAPVRAVYPTEGVSFQPSLAGIIKDCKNLDNAKKFIDYIVSKEGQDIIGTELTIRPIRADAQLASYMKPLSEINIAHDDFIKASEDKLKILELYKDIVTSLQE
ncbi:MAG: extracellular solute-binding protein [Spirochaetaceae bacterium]|jgi:iron(III) transport system substrate-binding protein|nr:extracellular solute-binding protein [Spirochaetaceae bacterium]